MVRRICWGLLAVLLVSALVFMPDTAAANVTTLPQTSHPVKVDGVLDDPAWRDAARIYLDTETRPGENIPARVRTIAYLVEDGERLYVAFDAEDPDPTAILSYSDSFVDDDDLDGMTATDRTYFLKVGYACTP